MVELDRATIPSLARAFMESRVLLTAVELDLFYLMGDGRLTSKQLAELGGWDQRGLEILLDALVVIGGSVKAVPVVAQHRLVSAAPARNK